MKSRILMIIGLILLCCHFATAQLPEAPIEAHLKINNLTPFERETFVITLTIISRGIEIRQQLDLAQLPDADTIEILDGFETLPVERKVDGMETIEMRRYRARGRGLKTGAVTFAPSLRLTARQRTRSFFGSVIQEHPVRIDIDPVILNIRPLPPPPDYFCGAIGNFTVDVSISPTNPVVGDLITVVTQISGEGYLDHLQIPQIEASPMLRIYPLKQIQKTANQRRFAQIVIPESEQLLSIPGLEITTFDTVSERYVTHPAGPFPIQFREERIRVVEQFQPGEALSGQTTDPPRGETERRPVNISRRNRGEEALVTEPETPVRIAPSLSSLVTFTVPTGNVHILNQFEDWILIEHRQNTGWIHQSMLSVTVD